MNQLVGGTPFTLPCTISKNGLGVRTRALIDTGANGFVFIDSALAYKVSKHLDRPILPLPSHCAIKGYDGGQTNTIRQYLELDLRIDGHKHPKVPMLLVPLGSHEVILGRIWAARYNVLPDCRNQRLHWPDETTETCGWDKVIATHWRQLSPAVDPEHQADAQRRNEKLDRDSWRPQRILQRNSQIEPERPATLKKRVPNTARFPPPGGLNPITSDPPAPPAKASIDICVISAAAFELNLKKKENTFFLTSLYEIDAILKDRLEKDDKPTPGSKQRRADETELQWLQRILPHIYKRQAVGFSKEASDKLPPHRPYDHKIILEDPASVSKLGYSPLYHQSTEELLAIKKYLTENLDKGFIENSYASFAAPTLFVKKANGSLRFCIDFRKLNSLTRKDRYPLPLINETLARLAKAKIYTKLDIRQAFHRIRMDPNSEELTTFRTRYGAYKCKVLPFGLTNGPATYQRYMNNVLFDYLDDFCTAYLDDILIYSDNLEEHEVHVNKVLDRLRAAGLQVDIEKTEFHVTRTKYLGFIVSTDGIQVDHEKVQVVQSWKEPRTVKGVQSFLGFCNFYRRFIRNYGRVAKPLNQLTRKDIPFKWTAECQLAFDELKKTMLTAPVLQHYQPDRLTMVETDASDGVVGAVGSQQDPETKFWHPIAYFSKTMAPAELNYDIHDKEMLAVILAFKEWRAWLQGLQTDQPVLLYSDHRALEVFMTTKKLSARQARWAELLSQYHFTLCYRAGTANQRADALSRMEEDVSNQAVVTEKHRTQVLLPTSKLDPCVIDDLNLPRLAPIEPAVAASDPVDSLRLVESILKDNRENPDLQELRTQAVNDSDETWTLREGLLLRHGKLYVTDGHIDGVPLTTAVIREAHDQPLTGHPGRAKLRQLLQSRYYWPTISKDINTYCANCYTCRRSHVPRDKKPGLLQQLPIPDRPWQHITVDFKKCPETKLNHNMVVIFVDRLSKRPITVPIRDTITARELVPIFLTDVVRHTGLPDSITSDRGPQFVSDFWNEVCKRLSIKVKLSTANHPQTDGQTEIVNQYFDQRLRPYVNHYQNDWDQWVAIVDYQQACLWHETTGQSPFLTEKGYEPRTSFDWETPAAANTPKERLSKTEAQALVKRLHDSWEVAKSNMAQSQERYATQANKHRRPADFGVGDKVWVSTKHWKTDRPSRKLSDQMAGPFEITEKVGHSFRLRLPDSIKVHPVFHADRLRRAPEDPLPGQRNPEPPALDVNDNDEFEVDHILAVRKLRGKLKYRVKWKGWDDDPDWYPASHLRHCPIALQVFHSENPAQPGPPKNLTYWLQCAENDVFPDTRPGDDM